MKRIVWKLHGSLWLFATAISALACVPGEGIDTTCADAATCIAFADTFKDFRTWPSTSGVTAPGVTVPPDDAGIHLVGPMTTYINRRPPSGSTSFPVGTVIVKEVSEGPLQGRAIHAMVKRGGDYDPGGAVDWEWFDLQNVDESNVNIVWRGLGPRTNDSYGGDPNICKAATSTPRRMTTSGPRAWRSSRSDALAGGVRHPSLERPPARDCSLFDALAQRRARSSISAPRRCIASIVSATALAEFVSGGDCASQSRHTRASAMTRCASLHTASTSSIVSELETRTVADSNGETAACRAATARRTDSRSSSELAATSSR
jgi:hypothetical protein